MNEQTALLQQQKPPRSTRPKARRRRSSFDPATYNSIGTIADTPSGEDSTREPGLTLAQILGLTICMAGVQFTCKSFFFLLFLIFRQFLFILKHCTFVNIQGL